MTVTLVQVSSVHDVVSDTTSSLTLVGAPTSGNALIVGIFLKNNGAITADNVTDNQSNTYTADLSNFFLDHPSGLSKGYFFSKTNITNAPTTITVTYSAALGGAYVVAWEVSGLRTTSPLDTSASNGSSTSGTAISLPFTTTYADSIAFAILGQTGVSAVDTPGSGWTNDFTDSNAANFLHNIYTTSGSKDADGTWSVSTAWSEGVVSYMGAIPATTVLMGQVCC